MYQDWMEKIPVIDDIDFKKDKENLKWEIK